MNVELARGAQHAALVPSRDRRPPDPTTVAAAVPAALPQAGAVRGGRTAALDLKTLLALQQRRRDEPERRDAQGLTEEQRQEVAQLKKRDREVRRHEQAHANAGGPYAGQPSYDYVTGPDGRQYAVAGHVNIDTGSVPGNPKATVRKMATVKRAALAPMEPSSKDRAVAAAAEQAKRQAELEMRQRKAEEAEKTQERRAEPGASVSFGGADVHRPVNLTV